MPPTEPTPAAEPALTPAEADALLASTVLTEEGRQDPYGTYRRLREGIGRWHSQAGANVVTHYTDCLEVLRHPKLGRPEADMDRAQLIGNRPARRPGEVQSMLTLNPPDHTRIRSLVSRAFTPRRVEALRPAIAALLEPVLDRFLANGGGDLVSEVAAQFPIAVISELLGVPGVLAAEVQPLVRAITALIDSASSEEDISRGEAAAHELTGIFDELIEAKRSDPGDDLLSALIAVEEAGDRLSHQELIANTVLLYSAGFETTGNLIGIGTWLLLAYPEQQQRLRDDPGLVPSAVMEMLRFDSPVQLNVRAALKPVELFGEDHGRGTTFIVLQGSGNRDEGIYPDAAGFRVDRFTDPTTATILSFGWGAHHCLGAHLARAEGELVFAAMLAKFASIELDETVLGGPVPRYRSSFTLRGLESLPLKVRTG